MTTRHKLNINNNININNNKNNNINNTDLLRKSFFTFCRHALASQFWAYVWFYMGRCRFSWKYPPVGCIWMLALFINPLASFASQKRPNHGTLALSGKPSKNEILALSSVLGNDLLICKWLQENV